jgi:hypothetical protein
MSYDLEAIREKVSMLELLAADGIAVQRKGARWFCACPFHAEKTASMVITERTGLFKCFGCGAGGKGSGIKGDVFGYWMATRGVEFHEAATALARMAGTGELPDGSRLPARKIVERAAPVRPAALAGRDLENWREGVEYLRESAGEHARLAEWRGYSRDTIALLLERGAIGQPIYSGKRAWAFAVEAMNEDGARFLCGWHVRVEPKGSEKKASWRFVPGSSETQPSIGAWPMVLGDPATARALIFCEGEWDLAAAADLMAWGLSERTKRVAIFGVRGGRNLAHTLGYQWPGEAQAFLFPDADETGGSWLEPDGLAALIKPRVRALHAFTFDGCKDLNDYHKSRGTGQREQWAKFFRDNFKAGLRRRKRRKPKAATPS